jgi:hypothetical protein
MPSALAVFRLITNSYFVGLHWQIGRLLALQDALNVTFKSARCMRLCRRPRSIMQPQVIRQGGCAS